MPASTHPVRIALVGLGGHGRTIQGAAEAAPGLDVVAVYDPDPTEAAGAAARFGCEAVPSYETLLARDDLDAVSLCSPNAVHRAQAEAAFAAGLDVFVEKPIANTVADGRAMVEAAEAAGRTLMVGHNMRFGAAMRWGREMIAAGRLGEVVSVEVPKAACPSAVKTSVVTVTGRGDTLMRPRLARKPGFWFASIRSDPPGPALAGEAMATGIPAAT